MESPLIAREAGFSKGAPEERRAHAWPAEPVHVAKTHGRRPEVPGRRRVRFHRGRSSTRDTRKRDTIAGVDIIVRPNPAAAEQTVDIFTVLDGEIVIEDVVVDWRVPRPREP